MLDFGFYPTPVECIERLSTAKATLWVKRDDLTNPLYGGSKVRKLGPLLAEARDLGAKQIVTLGAVGSHHVLATAIFAKRAGLKVAAVLLRQPRSTHVLETVRASIGQGVVPVPVSSYAEAMQQLAVRAAGGAYAIPAGGSSLVGTRGIASAAEELADQVRAGLLPEPDLIVLPLGSGGTAAGLAAGLVRSALRSRVLAIPVAQPLKVFVHKTRALAAQVAGDSWRAAVAARLEVDERYLGVGYGHSTPAGEHARREAASQGLKLDDTYTAKAFAAALDRIALGRERNVLFWNTLSSADMAPLLLSAPHEHELAPEVRALAYA